MATDALKILVVDDEQHQLETVCRGLFLYGYESVGAQSAKAALELLNGADGDSFDLMLTDLTMPGNSGVYLIEQTKKTKPTIPIIVITGLAATKEIDFVRGQGIPILQKPFEPDDLDKAIRALISSTEKTGT
ncbi:MAG: response regulator [Proteobacteria bacterium]|nr:response regulator [Pseudomonadota bacterium]